ncbi:MAG: RNA polymerase subunit sigma-70, partial [Solirubrobacterales bacterium]|nr:RNA polymerase subunit sigma-70 [Solirubrobacterales bacterium]
IGPLSGLYRWHHIATQASGQPAVGCYTWHEDERAYLPFALDVLTLSGERIEQITAFIARSPDERDKEVFARWPDAPPDPQRVASIFGRLGLPERVSG